MLLLPILLASVGFWVPRTDIVVGYSERVPFPLEVMEVGEADGDGHPVLLEKEAAIAFGRMRRAAGEAGFDLQINYGFRSQQAQQEQYRLRRRLAAKPGSSPHQRGIAVDLRSMTNNGRKTPLYYWIMKNCADFGFKQTIRGEKWHFEYMGGNS